MGFFTPPTIPGAPLEIPSVPTISDLPDPATFAGNLILVESASQAGIPSLLVKTGGQWLFIQAGPPVGAQFTATKGGGAGELPEDIIVAASTDVGIGSGWSIDSQRQLIRPGSILQTPISIDDMELGNEGRGLWNFEFGVNIDIPVTENGLETTIVLQINTGSGWNDVDGGAAIRVDLGEETNLQGISLEGAEPVRFFAVAGDRIRLAIRHDDTVSRTYTFNEFTFRGTVILPLTT